MRRWWSIKQAGGSSRGPPLEPQGGIGVELDRLKMETVIGVGMWCQMGMRLLSSALASASASAAAAQPTTFTRSQCKAGQAHPKAAINQLNGNEMTPAGEALQGPACRVSAWER